MSALRVTTDMMTDVIIACILVFLIWRGMSRGFLRSLLGPASFVIGTAAAYAYYNISHNIFVSVAIGFFGPFILLWFFRVVVNSFSDVKAPSPLSSALGALVTVSWGMVLVLPVIAVLALLPPMYAAINSSYAYAASRPLAKYFKLPEADAPKPAPAATKGPQQPESPTVKALAEDKRMQEILNDPTIVKAIEEKNYAALMSNPKIMAIAQDMELMKKVLATYGNH